MEQIIGLLDLSEVKMLSAEWLAISERCSVRLPESCVKFLELCVGVLDGKTLTLYAPDALTLGRLNNDRVKTVLLEESGAERVKFCIGPAPISPTPEIKHDNVNHPPYYTAGKVECIDAIEAALAGHTDGMEAFLTGQVIKYMWRWPGKNGVEDLQKAEWYLKRLIAKRRQKKS